MGRVTRGFAAEAFISRNFTGSGLLQLFPIVTEKAESKIRMPNARRWAIEMQGGRSWVISPSFFF